jgi:hypothetical protein
MEGMGVGVGEGYSFTMFWRPSLWLEYLFGVGEWDSESILKVLLVHERSWYI